MNESEENNQSFNEYKEMIIRASRARKRRIENPEFSTLLPEEIRIQLTTNCNLRCKHCFQWNQNGYFKKNDDSSCKYLELPINVLEKIIKRTYNSGSAIYLWGGEPLIYSRWDLLAGILENDDRPKVISTNGVYVNEMLETLNKISENLDVVFSVDGLEKEHDYLRGKETFRKIVHNIHLLEVEKKKGRFKGKISINCSIHNKLVPSLHEFVEFCNTFHIHKLILGFPWYINAKTCKEMDEYYQANFNWLNNRKNHYTWHSFNYHIDYSLLSILESEIDKINSRSYNFIIRFHPDVKNDLSSIITGDIFKDEKKARCIAPSCRMALWANGDVSFCGDFPEFCVDSLLNNDFDPIWKSEKFNRIRRVFNTNPKPLSLCQRCRFTSDNLI